MDPAPTRYVDRGGAALAYQVIGSGPVNLVAHLEIVQHLDLCWTDPHIHHNFERLAGIGRAVVFQRRGVALSDPVPYVPTLEQQAEDVLAVMDAEGMDSATLFGTYSATLPLAMVAACAPERVSSLVLNTPFADGLPIHKECAGWRDDEAAGYRDLHFAVLDQWGSGLSSSYWSPAADTPYNRRLMALLERSSATPAAARAHSDWYASVDVSDVLRAISVPTHVLRQASDRLPEAVVRHVAALVPGATYNCLPAIPLGASLGECYSPLIDFVGQLVTGAPRPKESDRSLATVLFTDIVDSTVLLSKLGDARYREIRDAHERQVHLAVEDAGGRLVKVLGDGTLSIFDGPGRAVRCGDRIRREAAAMDLQVRAGLHTGEVERFGTEIAGMTVHIAARVAAMAEPNEILVSRTVRDIVVGSGLDFVERGERQLKGVPDRWQLYAVSSADRPDTPLAVEPSMQTFADRTAVAAARRAPATMRTLMRVGNAMQRRRARRDEPKAATTGA